MKLKVKAPRKQFKKVVELVESFMKYYTKPIIQVEFWTHLVKLFGKL